MIFGIWNISCRLYYGGCSGEGVKDQIGDIVHHRSSRRGISSFDRSYEFCRRRRPGVVIDFGCWDVVWTEMVFQEDWDAVDALEKACEMNGFSVVFGDAGKTSIISINGQLNL